MPLLLFKADVNFSRFSNFNFRTCFTDFKTLFPSTNSHNIEKFLVTSYRGFFWPKIWFFWLIFSILYLLYVSVRSDNLESSFYNLQRPLIFCMKTGYRLKIRGCELLSAPHPLPHLFTRNPSVFAAMVLKNILQPKNTHIRIPNFFRTRNSNPVL